MASKTVATKTVAIKAKAAATKDSEAPEKEGADAPDAPLPLLDLSDAAVKKMIKQAKKRGFVTYEQLNSVMPSEEVTTDQIEDVLAMMSEMGINVVETEEADSDEEEGAREEAEEEEAEGGGPHYTVFLRGTDGAPPTRLGEGIGHALSPDGKWVVTQDLDGNALKLVPTGAGEARTLTHDNISYNVVKY